MHYPVAIEPGTATTAFGVVIPDLPGCFSAGDTLEDAMAGAKLAALAWIEATREAGDAIPLPASIESIRQNPDFTGWIFDMVTVEEPPRAM